MKLFMFQSYDDYDLHVCKNQKEAEKLFEKVNGYKVDGNFKRVYEIKEVDGYGVSLIKEAGRLPVAPERD